MNIMVTGASGFVGYDLIKLLLKYNHKIFAIYRSNNTLTKKLLHKNLMWKKMDLKDQIYFKKKIDIIIHCAATHSFSKKKSVTDYINSNIISLNNLIDLARRLKTKMIINFSTVSIYGQINTKRLDEKYTPVKQDLLGLTKHIAENIISIQPINFINLRLPGIMCSRKNNSRPWLQTLINKIKNNKNVYVYNTNNYFNNVIDTKEIVRLILRIIKKRKKIRGTFNLSASKPQKLKKIIHIIKSKYQSKSKVINLEKGQKSFVISINRIKEKLNFYPTSVENIILRNL